MTNSEDGEAVAQKRRFASLLDLAAARGICLRFWWRDDDAETETPALERLLSLAKAHEVPLALAVVPKNASVALARRLARETTVRVLQHGWQHKNYAPEDERKVELGNHRPTAAVIDELQRGFDRLSNLFGEKFLPVLVPPWNRIFDEIRERRYEAGLLGFSDFGPAPANQSHWVNPHLDIFAWRPKRRAISRAEAYALLGAEMERRIAGDSEPIGIMTHHLIHVEENWALLDDLLGLVARHRATSWPAVEKLFSLPTAGQGSSF